MGKRRLQVMGYLLAGRTGALKHRRSPPRKPQRLHHSFTCRRVASLAAATVAPMRRLLRTAALLMVLPSATAAKGAPAVGPLARLRGDVQTVGGDLAAVLRHEV